MKRNKIILAALILSVIVLVFSGCGGGNPVVPPIDNGDDDEEEHKFWDGEFSGYQWERKDGFLAPGPNNYSKSIDNVWKDDQGNLHLRIIKRGNKWYCAEIYSEKEGWGYGKYTFYIDNVIMKMANGEEYNATELDKNVVIGLYTYDNDCSHPSKNEIDLEFSEWGNSGFDEGWFIVWEDASPGQLERDRCNFPIQLVGKSSVHSFDWTENSIDFKSASGGNTITAHYPSDDFNDFGDLEGDGYIPQPQNEKVLMNIWLTGGQPYSDNMKSAEIIISSFEFDRDEQTQNHPPDITSSPVTSATKDQPYSYDVNATDPDVGDTMTYSLTTKPTGMTINSSTGLISWTPTLEGNYNVTVKASDGELFDTQSFTINVEPSTETNDIIYDTPCDIWTARQSGGGAGITTDIWDISAITTGSEIDFTFDAINIPDRWFIYYNGVLVHQTGWRGDASYDGDPLYPGGVTSPGDGQVLAVIIKLAGVNILEIRTEGKDSNTEWDYRLRSNCNNDAYALRDIGPAGGYIFYDKGSYSDGWRYLEAAPASAEWTDKLYSNSIGLIGATGMGIGTGQSNTTIIVTYLIGQGVTGYAAQLCNSLVCGGYSDWFLASIDELHLMYTNLKVYGVGGFKTGTYDYYWSSSEESEEDAWSFRFNDNYQGTGTKHLATNYVRAVRAF